MIFGLYARLAAAAVVATVLIGAGKEFGIQEVGNA